MTGKMKMAFAISVLLTLCAVAFADGDDNRRDDRDNGYYAFNHEGRERDQFYRQGLQDGRSDREHGRRFYIRDGRWDDRGDRNAYIDGYRAGFGSAASGWRGGDDRSYGRDQHDPYYGRNYQTQAYNFGFEDGLRIGLQDRNTGHSFRPTHGDRYDDADRGYDPSFGNKQAYKSTYRSGYFAGYQRSYYQR